MPTDRDLNDRTRRSSADASGTPGGDTASETTDPNDEVPVPGAMSAAEIDERAQVVEALRARSAEPRGADASGMQD